MPICSAYGVKQPCFWLAYNLNSSKTWWFDFFGNQSQVAKQVSFVFQQYFWVELFKCCLFSFLFLSNCLVIPSWLPVYQAYGIKTSFTRWTVQEHGGLILFAIKKHFAKQISMFLPPFLFSNLCSNTSFELPVYQAYGFKPPCFYSLYTTKTPKTWWFDFQWYFYNLCLVLSNALAHFNCLVECHLCLFYLMFTEIYLCLNAAKKNILLSMCLPWKDVLWLIHTCLRGCQIFVQLFDHLLCHFVSGWTLFLEQFQSFWLIVLMKSN